MRTHRSFALTAFEALCILAHLGCTSGPSSPEPNAAPPTKQDHRALFAQALEHEMKGGSCWMSDKKAAREHYARFRELAGQALELSPSDPEYQATHVVASIKYADCCWHLGSVDEAKELYANAHRLVLAFPRTNRAWEIAALGLFAAYGVMGDASMRDDDYQAARRFYAAAQDIAEEWRRRTPGQKDGSIALCLAHLKASTTCILQAEYDRAEEHLARAEGVAEGARDLSSVVFTAKESALQGIRNRRSAVKALRAEAGNAGPQLDKAEAFHALGMEALACKEWAVARAYLKKAVEQRTPFLKDGARSVRLGQALAYRHLAAAEKETGKTEAAREHYGASLDVISKFLPDDKGTDIVVGAALVRMEWAKLEEAAGKRGAARKLCDAATTSLEELERDGKLDEYGKRVLVEVRRIRPKSLLSE